MPKSKRPTEIKVPGGVLSLIDRTTSVISGTTYLVRTCDCGRDDCDEIPIVLNLDELSKESFERLDPIKSSVNKIRNSIEAATLFGAIERGKIVELEINRRAYAAICGVDYQDIH